MTPGVEDILDRLDGVEHRPRRLDRDARRAVVAVLLVAAVSLGLALSAGSAGVEPAEPADSPASTDLLGAFERLRITPTVDAPDLPNSDAPAATPETVDGYESIEAIAPGRRT